MEYQVTLFSKDGKYKPISALVKKSDPIDLKDKTTVKNLLVEGTIKICQKRLWQKETLLRYGYTIGKVRVYDKVKIEAENKARYEKIKEEKYASGEWKRPKREENKNG